MTACIVGAGQMGYALAFDLARSGAKRIIIADIDLQKAEQLCRRIASPVLEPARLDASNKADAVNLFRKAECVIGASSYTHNPALTEAAIEAGAHFLDLGGNDEIVRIQRTLHEHAVTRNVLVIPNGGLAPGLANVLAARGIEQFDTVDRATIRVGGVPLHPVPPLNYQLVFSPEGLLNEYSGRSIVLRDYRVETVETLTEIEELAFPSPFGTMEAFHTSGGSSLLPEMFKGKVRELNYKTVRFPGHAEKFKALMDLGFASSEPVTVGTNVLTAREMFVELLKRKLPSGGPDAVLCRVLIEGTKGRKPARLTYEFIDFYNSNSNITAMMRTTSYPVSVIAQLIVHQHITARGVYTPEQCVPLEPLVSELGKRDIQINVRWDLSE